MNHGESKPLGISDGLSAAAKGAGFIISTPSVWLYALIPVAMALFLTTGLAALGIWAVHEHGSSFFASSSGFWVGVLNWLLHAVFYLLAVFVAVLLGISLAQPLSGFALEKIVHAQEFALTGYRSAKPPLLVTMTHAICISLLTVLLAMVILGSLLVVNIVFPPAMVVTVPLKFLVCSWFLAWDFLDYPLGMRGLGMFARLKWVGRNFNAFTSFGMSWAFLVVIPGVVLMLVPMGVAGATRLAVFDAEGPSLDTD